MSRQRGSVKVEGIAKAVRDLEALEPDLMKGVTREVRTTGREMEAAVESRMPAGPPMTGFGTHRGRSSWANRGGAKAEPGTGRRSGSHEWPLLKIVLTGWASAMTDMAGAGGGGKTEKGRNMTRVLSSRYGKASRWVYPAVEGRMRDLEEQVSKGIDKAGREAEQKINGG